MRACWAIFTNICAITLLLYRYKYFALFPVVFSLKIGILIPEIQRLHKCLANFCHDAVALRCHQKQLHVIVTFEGMQVSVQYQVSIPVHTCSMHF